MDTKLQFRGLLQSPASWAKVARELLRALVEQTDVNVRAEPCRGQLWSRDFVLPEVLNGALGSFDAPDATLMFAYPPRLSEYKRDSSPVWNLSVYEASRLPPSWVEPLNQDCRRVLVPSEHNYQVYKNSGVKEEGLETIPFGYRQEFIAGTENNKPVEKPLNLLTLATPHYRKGLDLLLPASDIAGRKQVNWRVHLPYRPDGESNLFWEDPQTPRQLEKNNFRVTTGKLSDREVTGLYSRADVVVQPSRSEGFGLAVLEGMAAGCPVVTTNWGGHLDFAGPGALRIGGHLREANRCQYDERNPEAEVFEPDPEELLEQLNKLVEQPSLVDELGRRARSTVKEWTWKRSAKILAEKLKSATG